MSKIIIVGGLPASGKTSFWEPFSKMIGIEYVDDFSKQFPFSSSLKPFHDMLNGGYNFIITEPYAVVDSWRRDFSHHITEGAKKTTIEWIMYANEPEVCLANAKRRENNQVEGLIRYLSDHYSLPDSCLVLPCWKETLLKL